MVLEPNVSARPSQPPGFEPTEILGADYGHLSMPEEQTSVSSDEPLGPVLPFAAPRPRPRQGGVYGTAELPLPPVPERIARPAPPAAPPLPAPVFGPPPAREYPPSAVRDSAPPPPIAPTAPAYMGPLTPATPAHAQRAVSPFRNEPIAETREPAATRTPPPRPRGDARNEANARLTALLHGPWLFPNEDD